MKICWTWKLSYGNHLNEQLLLNSVTDNQADRHRQTQTGRHGKTQTDRQIDRNNSQTDGWTHSIQYLLLRPALLPAWSTLGVATLSDVFSLVLAQFQMHKALTSYVIYVVVKVLCAVLLVTMLSILVHWNSNDFHVRKVKVKTFSIKRYCIYKQ